MAVLSTEADIISKWNSDTIIKEFSKTKRRKFIFFNFYFTRQGMVNIIVIVHEKSFFFAFFIQNILKSTETILIKKTERNHGVLVHIEYKLNIC